MIPPRVHASAQPRLSSLAPARSLAPRILPPSLVLALALATIGCGSKSETSTGPTPVKCQVSLEAPANSITAAGGQEAITVSAQPECSWTASSAATWITGLTPASGQGNGRVEFQAAANPAGTMRQGDIAVNDQHIPVQQQPAPCRFEVSPVAQTISAGGGTITIAVAAPTGCGWQASGEAGWARLTGTSGTGSGSVGLRVDSNEGATRSTALLVAGQTVTVTQESPTSPTSPNSPNCVFSLDQANGVVSAAGGSLTVAVSGTAGCAWTATSEVPWITVVAGASGTGSGTITFNVAATSGAARSGTLTIAGRAFTVMQQGAAGPAPAPNCSYSIAPDNQSLGAAGGEGAAITISTSAGCAWMATSQAFWITLTSPASGSGPGTVTFTVAANGGGARTGSLSVAGRAFTVTQQAAAGPGPGPDCSYSIAPDNQSIGAAGGEGATIAISTSSGCAWTAASQAGWITLTSPASGSGPGTATFTVAANGGGARTGSLSVAGRSFTVTQQAAAAPGPDCSYSIDPDSQSMGAAGGEGAAIRVSTSGGCAWTAASQAGWITVTSPASDRGPGTVRFTVAANGGGARTGSLSVAGRTFTVTQQAAAGPGPAPSCSYSIAPDNQSIGAAGGEGATIAISTSAGCAWTAASQAAWITLTSPASGSGPGTVTFTVAANGGGERTGSLSIAGRAFTVTQQAAAGPGPSCSYSIAPDNQTIGAAGGEGERIRISTMGRCAWTAASQAAWITLTSPASGSGPDTVTFTVAANGGGERTGSLSIAGRAFTVTQRAAAAPAPSCSYSIAPQSQSMGAAGGNGSTVAVSTAAGCAWSARSNEGWITLGSGANGNGPGVVTFSAAANNAMARNGTLTIAGQSFTVNQASACTFSINPTELSINEEGGPGTVAVSAGAGCGWTASSNDSWITITGGSSGSGNGTVRFDVASTNGKKRDGTLTIAGRTFKVDQNKKNDLTGDGN